MMVVMMMMMVVIAGTAVLFRDPGAIQTPGACARRVVRVQRRDGILDRSEQVAVRRHLQPAGRPGLDRRMGDTDRCQPGDRAKQSYRCSVHVLPPVAECDVVELGIKRGISVAGWCCKVGETSM
jgi:hypothetical protein